MTPHTGTLWVSNCVSTTVGDLTVTKLRMAMKDGAQFTRLGSATVMKNATLELCDDVAGDSKSRNLYLVTGSTIKLADGIAWETSHFYVDGVEQTAKTLYTSNDCAQIAGGGSVRIVPEVNVFIGGIDDDWDKAANWLYGTVPAAGETVSVPGTARLSSATPALGSVTVPDGGSLVFENEAAVLNATNVTVASGGLVTSAGPFTDAASAARVFICCTNLTVAAGGRIDVTEKGWSGAKTTSPSTGYGPGAGKFDFGASHGGYGGRRDLSGNSTHTNIELIPTLRYGDPDAPVTYGSGGGRYQSNSATVHGGGAIRLAVTDALVVNGEIRADGGACNAAGVAGDGCGDSGGAGGSVWIACGTLEGAGTVSAAGGNGSMPLSTSFFFYVGGYGSQASRPGGGGRVAVTCDAARQAAKSPLVKISASEGRNLGWSSETMTLATDDRYFTDAEPGTLRVSDILFTQLFGKGLSGRILGHSTVAVDGDLAYTWGHVRFEGAGTDFRVTGNLALSGAESRLEIGQAVVTNLSPWNYKWTGAALNKLRVGGNLTVSGGAALDVRAAEKGTLTDFGATVDVGGKMTIGAGSYVYACCDARKPIPVKFEVGALDVQAGGFLSANDRGASGGWGGNAEGWACTYGTSYYKATTGFPNGTATGGQGYDGSGGSHGGLGGSAIIKDGTTRSGSVSKSGAEADPYLPTHPGAGGSCDGYGSASPAGGGVIYLLAKGEIRVDGTVSADSWRVSNYAATDYMHYIGAGAGGSIYLFGDTFVSGASARLSARGCDTPTSKTAGGAGGGGCIAVWTGRGNLRGGAYRPKQLVRYAEDTTPAALGFAGTFDVTGGTNVLFACGGKYLPDAGKEVLPASHGGLGTIRFATIRPRSGAAIVVK